MFILDRVTGKPIFGVEERPVPKGDVPGEWYSPTQPFPVKPPAARARRVQQGTRHGAAGGHVGRARRRVPGALGQERRLLQRRPVHAVRVSTRTATPPKSTIQFPGGTGGVNWGGASRRSDDRLRVRQRARHVARRLDREEEARAELRPRHARARRSPTIARSVERRRPVLHVQRAAQGRRRHAPSRTCRASVRRGRGSSR